MGATHYVRGVYRGYANYIPAESYEDALSIMEEMAEKYRETGVNLEKTVNRYTGLPCCESSDSSGREMRINILYAL